MQVEMTGAYWVPQNEAYRIKTKLDEFGGSITIEQGSDSVIISSEDVIILKTLLDSAKDFLLERDTK